MPQFKQSDNQFGFKTNLPANKVLETLESRLFDDQDVNKTNIVVDKKTQILTFYFYVEEESIKV